MLENQPGAIDDRDRWRDLRNSIQSAKLGDDQSNSNKTIGLVSLFNGA